MTRARRPRLQPLAGRSWWRRVRCALGVHPSSRWVERDGVGLCGDARSLALVTTRYEFCSDCGRLVVVRREVLA